MATGKKAKPQEIDLQPGYESMEPRELNDTELTFREPLKLRYVLVDDLVLLEGNPKLHSLDLIVSSIVENGFRDAIAWDSKLNGGRGGIVEGNGRAEALKFMQDQGRDIPRGIATNNEGKWAAPVLFGIDAKSEAAALRYSLDHNLLTMAGGEFTALDMSRMFESETYLDMLASLADHGQLPLMVDGDDLQLLTQLNQNEETPDFQPVGADEQGRLDRKEPIICPHCGTPFIKD